MRTLIVVLGTVLALLLLSAAAGLLLLDYALLGRARFTGMVAAFAALCGFKLTRRPRR